MEALEARTVPDGNVEVSFVGHTLLIKGDDSTQALFVTGESATTVGITSIDGTSTFNGQPGPLTVNNVRDITIELGNGNDQLLITNLRNRGSLSISFGSGSNNLTMDNVGYSGQTYIRAGGGFNAFTLADSIFHNNVNLNTGGGADQVTALSMYVDTFWLVNPSPSNIVSINQTNARILQFIKIGGTFALGFSAAPAPPTAPTVQLLPQVANPTSATLIPFNVTFSEPVTSFNATGIQIGNGQVISFTQLDGQRYTFVVKPTGPGILSALVLPGAGTDANGNTSAGSNTIVFTLV
jgi:hypothetical protein